MKILQEVKEPLLDRIIIIAEISHSGEKTPSKDFARKQLAKDIKVKEDLVFVKHIYQKFGENTTKVIATIYNNEKTLKFLENVGKDKSKQKLEVKQVSKEQSKEELKEKQKQKDIVAKENAKEESKE